VGPVNPAKAMQVVLDLEAIMEVVAGLVELAATLLLQRLDLVA